MREMWRLRPIPGIRYQSRRPKQRSLHNSVGAAEKEGAASDGEAVESGAADASAGVEEQGGIIGQSMELATENEALALYYNPQTTEIAVKNKKDGTVWFSNPQDREEDSRASGLNKSMLSSQLLLNYSDRSETGKPQQYNSFDQSVKYKQFEYEKLDDGIRIIYTVGEKLSGVEQIPPYHWRGTVSIADSG